jgi:two-component system KDP operon response regulator KdpE
MPQLPIRVLIADDELKYVRSLTYILERQGYTISTASDGAMALELAARETPALMLLDVWIPKLEGNELCRRIRLFSLAPIVMLTALGMETDIAVGLEAGADDYLVKPFQIEVLLDRLAMLLQWSSDDGAPPGAEERLQVGELRLSLSHRRAWLAERPLPLTTAEYRLLYELASAAGHSVPEDVLRNRIWGADRTDVDQFVPIFVRRLRHKIEANPEAPQILLGQPDQGYRLGPMEAGRGV